MRRIEHSNLLPLLNGDLCKPAFFEKQYHQRTAIGEMAKPFSLPDLDPRLRRNVFNPFFKYRP